MYFLGVIVAIIVTAIGVLISAPLIGINLFMELHKYIAIFTGLSAIWFFIGQARHYPHLQSFIIDVLGLGASGLLILPLLGIEFGLITGYEAFLGIVIIVMGVRNIVNMFLSGGKEGAAGQAQAGTVQKEKIKPIKKEKPVVVKKEEPVKVPEPVKKRDKA